MTGSNGSGPTHYFNGHTAALQSWTVAGHLGAGVGTVVPGGGGPSSRLTDNEFAALTDVLVNEISTRFDPGRRGQDRRRDVRAECGWPSAMPDALEFLRLYQQDAMAGVVVDRVCDETFKAPGEVWDGEDDEGDGKTPFMAAVDAVGGRVKVREGETYYEEEEYNPLWTLLCDWDKASRVGRFGLLLIGLADGLPLSQPAAGVIEEGSAPEGFAYDYLPEEMRSVATDPDDFESIRHGIYGRQGPDGGSGGDGPKVPKYRGTKVKFKRKKVTNADGVEREEPVVVTDKQAVWNKGDKDRAPVPYRLRVDRAVLNAAYAAVNTEGTGGNCGIGAGGFQPGNTCASGGSGSAGRLVPGSREHEAALAAIPLKADKVKTGQGINEETTHTLTVRGEHVGTIKESKRALHVTEGGGHEKVVTLTFGKSEPGKVPDRKRFKSLADAKRAMKMRLLEFPAHNALPDEDDAPDPSGDTTTDPADEPEDAETPKSVERLLYCRVFTEASVTAVRWERNKYSPRYGQPTHYHVDFGDPLRNAQHVGPSDAQEVHWTRVLVLPSDARLAHSKHEGVPACWPVWPELSNLQKITGAGGEGYWRTGIPMIAYKTPPQAAGMPGSSVRLNLTNLRAEHERMMNSLDRSGVFRELQPEILSPSIVDPTPFVASNHERIAAALNMPVRKLLGSERGELASSEDEGDWNDEVRRRQGRRTVPDQLVPFLNRLILLGVLPEPEGGKFKCGWPAVDALSKLEQTQVFLSDMQAWAVWVEKNVGSVMDAETVAARYMGMTASEAQAMLDAAAEENAERVLEQQDMEVEAQKRMVDEGLAPDPAMEEDAKALDIAGKMRPTPDATAKIKPGKAPVKGKPAKAPTRNELAAGDYVDDAGVPLTNKSTAKGGGRKPLTGGQWVTLDNGVKVYLKSGRVVAGPRPVVEMMNKPGAGPKKDEPKKSDAPSPAKSDAPATAPPADKPKLPAGVHRMTKAGGRDVGVDEHGKIIHGPEDLIGKRLNTQPKWTPEQTAKAREEARNRTPADLDRLEKSLKDGRRMEDQHTTRDDLIEGMEDYSSSVVFRDVNEALRDGTPIHQVPPPSMQHLQRMATQRLKEPTVTYRGISSSVFNAHYKKLKTGDEVEARGFVSTSIDKSRADGFTDKKRIMMEIVAKRGIYMSDHSEYANERELVQPHGTKYKMVWVVKRDGQTLVQMEEV
jgi:hypothetical protein